VVNIDQARIDAGGGDPPQCTVCLEEMKLGGSALELLCKHVFHRDCIEPWLLKQASCPLCRRNLVQTAEDADDGMGENDDDYYGTDDEDYDEDFDHSGYDDEDEDYDDEGGDSDMDEHDGGVNDNNGTGTNGNA